MANTLREKRFNQILYISIGSALAVIILFIILLNIFSSIRKRNVKLSENNNDNAPQIEQANSQIGKNINEVKDDSTSENLSIELSQSEAEENLDNAETEGDGSNSQNTQNTEKSDELETANENTVSTNEKVSEANSNTPKTENIPVAKEKEEDSPDPVFTIPVEGEIVKQYGKDRLIYSNTLKEWTTHLGIDIKANKTAVVKASSDGVVKSIKNDPRYGLTVIIEHNKGFTSIYSNLLSSEFVTVGEKVKSGQTIGTVGNSATFEIVDEPHLHFEITKDGENIDPEMYIK